MKYFFLLIENKKTFEKTCNIVDSNYKLQAIVTPIFDDMGDFTPELKNILKKYKVDVYNKGKGIFFGDTYEEAMKRLRFKLEEIPKLKKWLTPNKQKHLINLFKK